MQKPEIHHPYWIAASFLQIILFYYLKNYFIYYTISLYDNILFLLMTSISLPLPLFLPLP